MGDLNNKQIQHLYWRAGFGISGSELKRIRKFSKKKIVDQLFAKSKQNGLLTLDLAEIENYSKEDIRTRDDKRDFRKLQVDKVKELNLLWVKQLQETKAVLRERMTLFFNNHFSVRIIMPRNLLDLNNIFRKHALGNFGTMLMEVSKSPAMIAFLNNQQNRKQNPNENFAREVMELFTLGRDNGYIEQDIKEAARAFTGWSLDRNKNFVYKAKNHDSGTKTILGVSGNFKGEDVIKILLENKQTAKYLTQKIYKYLVNDQLNNKHIEELSTIFYNANYDISTLLNAIFMSTWFYDESNIGVKIKSPIDLITGIGRKFNVTYKRPQVYIYLQRALNQQIFYPPNVAGWPGGRHWIDNSTLMIRLKLASVLLSGGVIDFEIPENSDSEENPMAMNAMMLASKNKKKGNSLEKRIKTITNWEAFEKINSNKNKQELVDFLIQPELSKVTKELMERSENYDFKSFVVQLLSLPEYQLC